MAYIYTLPIQTSLPDNFPTGGGGGGGSGTDNYNELSNKPKINSVTVEGNKTAGDLKLVDLKGIQAFSTMPSNAVVDTTIMYTGESGLYQQGAVYRKTSSGWTLLMSAAEAASISSSDIDSLFE